MQYRRGRGQPEDSIPGSGRNWQSGGEAVTGVNELPSSRLERAVLGLALAAFVAGGGLLLAERWWGARALAAFDQDAGHAASATASAAGGAGAGGSDAAAAAACAGDPAGTGGEDGMPARELVVHVAGAVRRPGVYRLTEGARILDAVEAAGGAAEGAVVDAVNLAAPVADGTQVYIPSRADLQSGRVPVPAGGGRGGAAASPGGPLDLNTASASQLEALPGIGPALAARIVEHRARHGPFRRLEDLLAVRGIGERTLEALRPHVVVR